MNNLQQKYTPLPAGADSTTALVDCLLGGFHAVTAGTITVNVNGAAVLNAFPVTAGQIVPLPWAIPKAGGSVVCAGGASGTLSYAPGQ